MKDGKNDYEKMEELYELYEQKIYYVAHSVLNNIQQAEDVVQETFITLYKHLGGTPRHEHAGTKTLHFKNRKE